MTWVSAAVTVLVTPEKTSEFGVSRYKVWSCRKDSLHVLCAGRVCGFRSSAYRDQKRRAWTGGTEGEGERLRLPFRVLLSQQGFAPQNAKDRGLFACGPRLSKALLR
jgi:hypothetical protein